jgi:hydroxymethylglutaryl-CoA lyase
VSLTGASELPRQVRVIEVGPRDGFQMEQRFIPTALKVRTIEGLAAAGLGEIEATSFVHPQVIPQLRDAAEVLAQIERSPRARYTALVPNSRGAERALAAGVDGLHLVIAASETYNQRNVRRSRDASFEELERIVALADEQRPRVPVAVTFAVTFGCPFEGQLPVLELVELAHRAAGGGAHEVGLADTAGLGHPLLVGEVVAAVQEALPALPLRMHLHDTRGLGLANAVAALQRGVQSFDTAFGGLGGCPVMHGATGNLATEDFVNLCAELDIETGIDLDSLRAVSREIEAFLERPLASRVLASGTREELYAANRVRD